MDASLGYCKEGPDRCVCGGDTPSVRAGCSNWIRSALTNEDINAAIKACTGRVSGELYPDMFARHIERMVLAKLGFTHG